MCVSVFLSSQLKQIMSPNKNWPPPKKFPNKSFVKNVQKCKSFVKNVKETNFGKNVKNLTFAPQKNELLVQPMSYVAAFGRFNQLVLIKQEMSIFRDRENKR